MEKKIKGIKKFFEEFQKFITRGNVLDMAVGVIVGGAFTGVVNGLSNYILKPIINWLLSIFLPEEGLAGAVTFLRKVMTSSTDANGVVTEVVDMANSIYIDWGSFISAIINFLLIAFTLFVIVRMINKFHDTREKALSGFQLGERKEIAKIRRERKVSKQEAKAIYEAMVAEEKARKAEEDRLAAEKAAEEAASAEAKATVNTRLLEEIRDLLKAGKTE